MGSAGGTWAFCSGRSAVTIEQVKELLRELGFPDGYNSDQTALTVLALADRQPRQKLLTGHSRLAEGARIHDVLNFVREDMGRRVAENTRESYRKTSLRPLVEAGWVSKSWLRRSWPIRRSFTWETPLRASDFRIAA
jgi:BsuBI/PstI restriction endonuclease